MTVNRWTPGRRTPARSDSSSYGDRAVSRRQRVTFVRDRRSGRGHFTPRGTVRQECDGHINDLSAIRARPRLRRPRRALAGPLLRSRTFECARSGAPSRLRLNHRSRGPAKYLFWRPRRGLRSPRARLPAARDPCQKPRWVSQFETAVARAGQILVQRRCWQAFDGDSAPNRAPTGIVQPRRRSSSAQCSREEALGKNGRSPASCRRYFPHVGLRAAPTSKMPVGVDSGHESGRGWRSRTPRPRSDLNLRPSAARGTSSWMHSNVRNAGGDSQPAH